jgi:alanyl-tRNA synthetase
MLSPDIRFARSTFWEGKGHKQVVPVSLVAAKDSTALFNVAGMQQLIPYLM